jgi:hypothetical protein
MTDAEPSAGKLWTYRFSEPDKTQLETTRFSSDEAAEERARQLSKSKDAPVVLHRQSEHIDAWEYVTEVDERA